MSKVLSHDEAFVRCIGSADSFIWFRGLGPLLLPQPYHVTLRRWLMSRLPSFGSFAVSKGVSPLQSFSGSCLKCHGCIGGGTRSLASCIDCPTCLRTAFMLRSSGTTLLMPRNTPHMATGLVALSSSTAALAWSRRFRLLA